MTDIDKQGLIVILLIPIVMLLIDTYFYIITGHTLIAQGHDRIAAEAVLAFVSGFFAVMISIP